MKIKIIDLNKPNSRTGRVYSAELIKNTIIDNQLVNDMLNTNSLFIEYKDSAKLENDYDAINMFKVVGVVKKLYIEDEALYLDYELLNTPLRNTIDGIHNVYLNGIGNCTTIDSKEIVDEFTFIKFTCD